MLLQLQQQRARCNATKSLPLQTIDFLLKPAITLPRTQHVYWNKLCQNRCAGKLCKNEKHNYIIILL